MLSFQGITIDEVGCDRSIRQEGKESPTLFNMVMRYWLRRPSAVWTTTKIQNTSGYTGGGRGTADIAHDFREQLPDLGPEQNDAVGDDAKRDGQIAHCDLEWKTDEMQHACWSSVLDETDLEFNMDGVDCKIQRAGNVGDGVAAVKRGRHDVGRDTPYEQSDDSNVGRNVPLQEPCHS